MWSVTSELEHAARSLDLAVGELRRGEIETSPLLSMIRMDLEIALNDVRRQYEEEAS